MAFEKQYFTVVSVNRSRSKGEENIYTPGMTDRVEAWVVRLTANSFAGRGMVLEMESELEAERFSVGQVYGYDEIGELFFAG